MAPSTSTEFERCSGWIQSALDRDLHPEPLSQVFRRIESGDYRFWPGERSVLITERLDSETLSVYIAAGDTDELYPMYWKLEAWARDQGYTEIMTIARPGWSRKILPSLGFDHHRILSVKDITHGQRS